MSFEDVYEALYDQLLADSTLGLYVDSTQIIKGFKDSLPQQKYTIILEPGEEDEDHPTESYDDTKESIWNIDVYARVILLKGGVEASILGIDSDKGVLAFIDDIKSAVRADLTLGYTRHGSSVSSAKSGTYALDATHRYITVSMNGKTPSGYNQINCGRSTSTGAEVATNIQTALQALGNYAGDGYYKATCTFADSKFTITSSLIGPKSTVVVTAGSSNDCSALLGFDDPTELAGRNLIDIVFGPVTVNNILYPVRYRVLPLKMREEIET